MNNPFIRELQTLKSKYANPGQASTQAKSLDLLSSGIYTEEERFVFELLQNAVDAYNGSSDLNVRIILCADYLIFMHNGEPFTKRDIEGLCDVGYGNKMSDVKKIGYKGIGFKSVFRLSHSVTVQSGDFCFKFEKKRWENYWDADWGELDNRREYAMPWQIIPIEATPPISVDTQGYNVITYIHTSRILYLENKVCNLLSSSAFLLFLRHPHINIEFVCNGNQVVQLKKKTEGDIVKLLTGRKIDSRWLVYCNSEVEINDDVRASIVTDGITPVKLQEAKTFDLSFAVAIDNKGDIISLEDSCVYTYLPTSISLGFPFLVNANFITDAGRQHLVKDSEWNKMIFRAIPYEFLKWIATISPTTPSYYRALPKTNIGSDTLCSIFNQALVEAIGTVAFIPSRTDKKLLKASEAIMDRVDIASVFGEHLLIDHINKKYDKTYVPNSLIRIGGIGILKEYGAFDLNAEGLKILLTDEEILKGLTLAKDLELISFLYHYCDKNEKERSAIKEILYEACFIFSDKKELCKPSELFFPSDFKKACDIAEDAAVIHPKIYESLCGAPNLRKWLEEIGVSEMDDISIISRHICRVGFITTENAIAVGRYLYKVWNTVDFTKKISDNELSYLKFLTNKGSLKCAAGLYQGSKYYPTFDIQSVCSADIFISDEYCSTHSDARGWHRFFLDMKIRDDIAVRELKFREDSDVYDLLKGYVSFAEKHEYNHSSWTGQNYYMRFSYINVKYVPYIRVQSKDIELAKIVWNHILSQPVKLSREHDYIFGGTGYNYTVKGYLCDKTSDHNYLGMNFLPWVVKHYQTFPASTGEMLPAGKLYRNTNLIKELFGKYMPYIDVGCEIDESWLEMLNLKTDPSLDEYLDLLAKIAEDDENAESNKNRISKIYNRIVEIFDLNQGKNAQAIKSWSSHGKILAKDGIFYSPFDLRYITIDGFSKTKLAYTGVINSGNKDLILRLFQLMGVSIITSQSVMPLFRNKAVNYEFKNLILGRAKVLALLKTGEKPTEAEFDAGLQEVKEKLRKTVFYQCESIELTYGDDNDTIDRTSFGADSNFYYVGELRLSTIEPLLTPLCNFLDLKEKERELLVAIFEDIDAIRDYLSEKEYDVSFLGNEVDSASRVFTPQLNYIRGDDQRCLDAITGFKGEILVYEKLKELGYNPICRSLADKDDYDQCVKFLGRTYYYKHNYARYDIEYVAESGKTVLIEVKTTTEQKEIQENMPISYREIKLLEECSADDDRTYQIIRVFDIDNNPDIYIFEGYLL